ncbi:MAG: helix-turn-helix domain-containing protein [Ruminococcus flavefaciens]|nr:helix-turn-helix domain-containing protein [Ruminococcus flavefaciens]
MQKARMLGNYLQQLAEERGMTVAGLGTLLGCSKPQICALFAGRRFLTFDQLSTLADTFHVSVETLLAGDPVHYNNTVTHNMNRFEDTGKREQILDIIDDYMDVFDALPH